MSDLDQEFLDQLKKAFAIEAEEHLHTIISGLIQMEKARGVYPNQTSLEEVYRAVHSLKGAARAVNSWTITQLCQSMETVFWSMKNQTFTPSPEDYDLLQEATDRLSEMLELPGKEEEVEIGTLLLGLEKMIGKKKKSPPKVEDSSLTTPEEKQEREGEVKGKTLKGPRMPRDMFDTIRVKASSLDALFLQVQELISIKLTGEQRLLDLQEIIQGFFLYQRGLKDTIDELPISTKGIASKKLGSIQETSSSQLKGIEKALLTLLKDMQSHVKTTEVLVDYLLEDTKNLLMVPFSTFLQVLPKMVRDISREQEKEVQLIIKGGETQVDKRILEQLKDPLLHLVRNAMDHGIEPKEERQRLSKPQVGTISILLSPLEGQNVQIQISDDGQGIDPEQVKESAIKSGYITRDTPLDRESALDLIFQSGISTSPLITDLSGRGLGMAIVKESIEGVGGQISIHTKKGEGTTFHIIIPLSQASLRGILLEEYGHFFVVPTTNVDGVLRIMPHEVNYIENRETISLREGPISLVRLGAVLDLPKKKGITRDRYLILLILQTQEEKMAFVVDKIIGEQEILLKGLGPQLKRVPNIAGATVLGTGAVVPVLHVSDLIKSAILSQDRGQIIFPKEDKKPKKRVLIAEDSITSRMLLTNIFTAAGFLVKAVVDGLEAWNLLQRESFHILITDVQMPRLDGFQLTARIRGVEKLANLPVVLVTSLETKEDKEKGAEVGADAYIVKSSFDQGNLLEVVKRLI